MPEKAKVPAIRFKGFTDAWEERKLGEISKTTIGEFVIKTKQSDESPYPVYNGGRSYTGKYDEYNNDGPKIVISARGANAGFVNYVSGRYWAGNSCYSVSVTKDDEFSIGYLYQFIKYNQVLFTAYQQAANIPSVSKSDVEKFSIKYPTVLEQKKIESFFKQLDNTIALHQRKLLKLKNVKKAMLEKMFPKNGSNVPEIRFAGFTDAWEQRKLRDLCILFADGDWIESKDQSDSGVRLVQTGNVGVAEYLEKSNNRKWISEDTFERLHCTEVLPGDILISRLPEPAGRACIMPFLGMKMITAVDCTIVRTATDCSNKFLIQYLSSQEYFNVVNTALAGGTRQRISRSNLASFDIAIPVKYEEQEAIGNFFERLDNLITLHQRKYEKLQNLKKACLEKMFV